MEYRVSIITSMFNGGAYIERFMEDATSQSIFDQCELVIVDANINPEKHLLDKYIKEYPNITYYHLSDLGKTKDPGVYGCWNLAIKNSSSEFVTNMNLDDSRCKSALSHQVEELQSDPDLDLVYYRTLETESPGESFDSNTATREFPCLEHSFSSLLAVNSPHCQPMWRRSIHEKYGFFNETLMSAGDYDMWLRASSSGARMKKIDKVLGLYFRNPDGISSGKKTLDKALYEVHQVKNQYRSSYV